MNFASRPVRALGAAAVVATILGATASSAGPMPLVHVAVADVTRAPIGWVEFCSMNPRDCAGGVTAPRDVVLSTKAWRDLVRVNNWVNNTIKPVTDLEHWGVVERWSYPDDGYGDCETYVTCVKQSENGGCENDG